MSLGASLCSDASSPRPLRRGFVAPDREVSEASLVSLLISIVLLLERVRIIGGGLDFSDKGGLRLATGHGLGFLF